MCRLFPSFGACPLQVNERLVPHLPLVCVLGETFHLLIGLVAFHSLNGLNDCAVKSALPLLDETSVCHLMRQGVLEGELPLREEICLINEFRCLKGRKTPVQFLLGHPGDGRKEGIWHMRPDDRGGLKKPLILER